MNECYKCGFYDCDYGACTCLSTDKWYACPIDSKKPENIKEMEEYIKWVEEQQGDPWGFNGVSKGE